MVTKISSCLDSTFILCLTNENTLCPGQPYNILNGWPWDYSLLRPVESLSVSPVRLHPALTFKIPLLPDLANWINPFPWSKFCPLPPWPLCLLPDPSSGLVPKNQLHLLSLVLDSIVTNSVLISHCSTLWDYLSPLLWFSLVGCPWPMRVLPYTRK